VAAAVLATTAACGGRASDDEAPAPDPGTSTADGGASAIDGKASASDGGAPSSSTSNTCIDLVLAPSELACETDQDCALVATGQVCSGYVAADLCTTGAANSQGVARITAALASVPSTAPAGPWDFCDAVVGTPTCIAGQCTICGPVPGNAPHVCPDDAGSDSGSDAEGD
jgi:hypothetical protein